MKRFLISLILFVFCPCLLPAGTLNVLILKHAARTELSFAQNYAVVIGEDHFYGPIAKENRLLLENANGKIRLTLHNPQKNTKKSLGIAKEKIDIVRSLGKQVDFNAPRAVSSLQSRPLPAGRLNLPKDAHHTSPFVTLRQAAYGGNITYSGPLTVYAKNGINIVETVALENYVTQVVNCELGGEKSLNALKAQSVMVRTFALFMVQNRLAELEKGNQKWAYFQLFSTPVDQAYNCRKRANDKELPSALVKKAVKETAGQVILRNKKLARVQYNTCAKRTLPKGVICQEKMVKMARSGKDYKAVLTSFLPGTHVEVYNMQFLSSETAHRLRQALKSTAR